MLLGARRFGRSPGAGRWVTGPIRIAPGRAGRSCQSSCVPRWEDSGVLGVSAGYLDGAGQGQQQVKRPAVGGVAAAAEKSGDVTMGLPTMAKVQFACTVIALPLFAVTLFFNYASSDTSLGIIPASASEVSEQYEVFITPNGWAFAIWGIIYIWLGAALVYALTQLCRKTQDGPVYLCPVTLPVTFWLLFFTNLALNVGWLFAWGYMELTWALVLLVLLAVTNGITLFVLHRRYYLAQFENPAPSSRENVFVKAFVHNGLALYTTWTIIAFLINFDIVLVYISGGSNEVVTSTLAGLLSAAIVIYLFLELTVLDKYTRWTITPGFVFVWALSAVFQKNYDIATGSTPALLLTALATACGSLAARLGTLVFFWWRDGGSGQSGSMTVSSGKYAM